MRSLIAEIVRVKREERIEPALATELELKQALAREGGYDMTRVATVASFKEAMAELQPRLKAGDVVLYENDLPDSFK